MKPIESNLSAIRNMVGGQRRATPFEYWCVVATFVGFVILTILIRRYVFPAGSIESGLNIMAMFLLKFLCWFWFLLILTTTIRRLQDRNMTGWYTLIYLIVPWLGFVILGYMCSRKGTKGANKYGPEPVR